MSALMFVCVAASLACASVNSQFAARAATTQPVSEDVAPCRNARGLAGLCVSTDRCDHSTDHIDLRLYRPKNYTSPCTSPQMCCPTASIVNNNQAADSNTRRFDDFD